MIQDFTDSYLPSNKALVVILLQRCDASGTIIADSYHEVILPTMSEYQSNTATLVDSSRNSKGKMIGSVIRDDIAKITMNWKVLSASGWAKVNQCFHESNVISYDNNGTTEYCVGAFINKVRFYNQASNAFETRSFYVSDRSAGLMQLNQDCDPIGYEGAKFSLIEQ